MNKCTLFSLVILCISQAVSGITVKDKKPVHENWKHSLSENKMFIRNNGQLTGIPGVDDEVLFGIDNSKEQIVFTKKGISFIYVLPQKAKKSPLINFKTEENEEKEKELLNNLTTTIVSMTWKDADPGVQVIAEEEQKEFYYYKNPASDIPYKCAGYKKITYKNLYPGIDVEYTFHQGTGYKYTIIVHPDADPSKISMVYSGNKKIISDEMGGLLITTDNGTIIDHAPVSFSANNHAAVTSSFLFKKNNTVAFNLGNYDPAQDLIIDPWTISPGFTTVNKGYDVVRNSSTGDIFVYGGAPPYELKKFSSSGALIWTYVTSLFYLSGSTFYGDVAIDPAGDIYLANGCCSNMIMKLNGTSMASIWTSSAVEPWRLTFDIAGNHLVAAGYVISTGENVMTIDPATGSTIASAVIIGPTNTAEVRAAAMTPAGNILLMHVSQYPTPDPASNNVSSNTPALVNQFAVPSNYLLDEEGAYYAINEYSTSVCATAECFHGINAFAAKSSCFYTYDGAKIYKRNITTGASMGSVTVPGGMAENVSGIAVDSCGNVFAGTQTGIAQYDSNLVFIASTSTGSEVYDVINGGASEIITCGDGFLSSLFFPCSSFYSITTATPVTCSGLCNGTATASTPSGIPPYTFLWSNGAITQTISGLCTGTYTVTVTDSAGTVATNTATVTSPAPISIIMSSTTAPCGSAGGSASANPSGGTGAYTYLWSPGSQNTASATSLSPGSYTVTVTDTNSCSHTGTVVVGSGLPPSLSLTSTNINCYGACSGTTSSNVINGTSPYSFSWSNGSTNSAPAALCAGSYTCIVSDFFGCKDTSAVVITQAPQMVLTTSFVHCHDELPNAGATVLVSGGTPGYTYLWNTSPSQSGAAVDQLSSGTYVVVVTDASSCVDSAVIVIPDCPVDSIFVPNVFTPNGDGVNDLFVIYNTGYNSLNCEIFNRWGKKVYEWNSVSGGWNGKINDAPASDGVYYYIIKAEKYDGSLFENNGFLQLLAD